MLLKRDKRPRRCQGYRGGFSERYVIARHEGNPYFNPKLKCQMLSFRKYDYHANKQCIITTNPSFDGNLKEVTIALEQDERADLKDCGFILELYCKKV